MKFRFDLLFFVLIFNGPLLAAEAPSEGGLPPQIMPAESAVLTTGPKSSESQPLSPKPQSTASEDPSTAKKPAESMLVSTELTQSTAIASTFYGEATAQLIQNYDRLSEKLISLSRTNEDMSKKIDALRPSTLEKLYPAIFGFLGVLLGGLINLILHKSQISYNREERKEKFSFEVKQKIFEYRSKQNNDFYGPLLVLLAQSKELSSQLHDQIQKFDSTRYGYRTNITDTSPKKTLHVLTGRNPVPFRLIEELPYLGKHISASLPQVAVIIEVGEQLSALIERSSGLANPKNLELSGCLGNYLAHLRALKDSYEQAKDSTSTGPTRLYTAVFPRQIYDLAKKDYDEINTQIAEWERQSNVAEV